MTDTQLLKLIHEHFKPRSSYERTYLKQYVLPFAKKLAKEAEANGMKNSIELHGKVIDFYKNHVAGIC